MKKKLKELAELVEGVVVGDPETVITGTSGIKEAGSGDITFLTNTKYTLNLQTTKASAIVAGIEAKDIPCPLIRVKNPSLAFAKIVSLFSPVAIKHPKGIHKSAIIGKNVRLGKNIAVGAYAVIEDDVEIGNDTIIYAGCFVGNETKIGKNTIIYPHVTIRECSIIGNNVMIHNGTVIGSDGFGYETISGVHHKIPQTGIVEIEDDVEIGANVTIDRARFDKTLIKKGTKIDNLVQIAHNVIVGENSIIVAQVAIAGSTVIGKNVTIAGQAGVAGHITVGDNVIIAGKAGVTKSVEPNTIVSGFPAKPHNEAKRVNACVQRLPELYKKIEELEKRLKELKQNV